MENVIEVLKKRGFIDQIAGDNIEELFDRPVNFYAGFDPTADSLHLGNLVTIIAMVWLQKYGHRPYALIGGATGRIGDPSGKSIERPAMDAATLAGNIASISKFLRDLFKRNHLESDFTILNNNDWLGGISFLDFLGKIGKHFRMSQMLAKESVKMRLSSEEGLSFTEFSYQVLQGYDFYYLNQTYGIKAQLGGSDQWGNITAGIELARKISRENLYCFTFPLLTRSDGQKFGKSESGAIWLSSEKLSPYEFYQHLVKVSDKDVIKLLTMLTFLDLEEIRGIEAGMQRPDYESNLAQKRLAAEVTRFVHGEEGLEVALKVTESARPGKNSELDAAALQAIAKDMPNMELQGAEVLGQKLVDVAVACNFFASKSEGVRLIKNGGVYLNNGRIDDPSFVFQKEHLIDGRFLLLGFGKKKKILLTVKGP